MRSPLQIPIAIPFGDETSAAQRRLPLEPPERETERALRRWNLDSLAGGITEISGPVPVAGLTAAARLIREAQERGEPAAWIAAGDSLFYPPDLHDWGVDLQALPVLRVPGAIAAARAAECLLRSGAFALVVFDLGRSSGLPTAVQVRLAALCRRHRTAFLLLAQKPEGAPPAASMAFVRAEGAVRKSGFDRFTLQLRILRDKRQGAGWSHEELLRAPDGLC